MSKEKYFLLKKSLLLQKNDEQVLRKTKRSIVN